MRLVCPNCGAQYEVADDVIPETGRDVQCSNCGHTWFKAPEPAAVAAEIEMPIPAHQEQVAEPEIELEDLSEAESETLLDATPERAELDPTVADILKEEAAREESARAQELSASLESQTEMGLDAVEETVQEDVQDRVSRLRGKEDNAIAAAAAAAASRKEMLPDIEEINSTLRSSEERGETVAPEPEVVEKQKKRGFRTGFYSVLLIILLLVLLYLFADQIIGLVPALEGPLTSYVDLVNSGRLWLDGQIGGLRDAMQSAVDANTQPAADTTETGN